MAFLHGVLSAVRDDDSVKTYDKNGDNITKVITTLHDSVGKGREAFGVAVTEVEERTDKVTAELGENDNVYYKRVTEQEGSKLEEQLEHWKSTLVSLKNEVDGIQNTQIKALDNTLQSQITHKIEPITSVIDHLQRSASDEVMAACQGVDDRLTEQQKIVIEQIKEYCEGLLELLYEECDKVFNELAGLNDKKDAEIEKIKKAVEKSKELAVLYFNKFEANYRLPISRHFEKINEALQPITPKGDGQHSQLYDEVDDIKRQLMDVGGDLSGKIVNLNDWKVAAEKVVDAAQKKCNEVLKRVDKNHEENGGGKNGPVIYTQAQDLQDKATALLLAYSKAQGGLKELVSGIKKQVDGLKKHIVKDLGLLKGRVEGKIEEHVKGIINAVLEAAANAKTVLTSDVDNAVKTLGKALQNVDGLTALGQRIGSLNNGDNSALKIQSFLKLLKDNLKLNSPPTTGKYTIDTLPQKDDQEVAKTFIDEFKRKAGEEFKNPEKMTSPDDDKHVLFKVVMGQYHTNAIDPAKELNEAIEKVNKALDAFTTGESGKEAPISSGGINAKEIEFRRIASTITDELPNIAWLVEKDKGTVPTGKAGNEDGILDILKELRTNALGENEWNKITGKTRSALGKLKTELSALYENEFTSESKSKIHKAITKVIATVTELEKVPSDVKKQKEIVDGLLQQLRDKFDALAWQIDGIQPKIVRSESVLNDVIQCVNQSVFSARKTLTDTTQKIEKDLTETAKNAFEEITVQVRLLFSHSRTADLTALQKLVNAQKTAIEGIITKDLANGVKGLLDKMLKTHQILGPMKDDKELKNGTPKFKHFYEGLWSYIIGQIADHPSKEKASKVNKALTDLLQKMIKENHFSYEVSDLIKKAADIAEKFSPAKFTDSSSPILQALKDGIGALAKQLGYAYVSTYCCRKFDGALLDPDDPAVPDDKRKLTEYGKKLSKVFMTCLPGWGKHLDWLRRHCDKDPKGPWNGLQITKLKNNPLGLWFDSRGYKVSDSEKPEGELNIIQDPKHGIHGLLVDNREIEKRLYRNDDEKKDPGTLREVCKYLPLYFQVRHHEHFDSPKPPTTVSHMLQWITGLTYNPMLEKLDSHFTTMFQGLKKAYKLDNPHIAITKPFTLSGALNDNTIRSSYLSAVLRKVCETAESVLIAFQGHGHAAGRYACEYSSNVDKLDYTTSPSKCFDLLCEICLKLHDQLNFLYRHCSHPSKLGGWQDCWYGNGVAGTSWQCNNLQCPDQPYNQEGNQKHNQQCDQNCNQNADCGLKSPLQSYLKTVFQVSYRTTLKSLVVEWNVPSVSIGGYHA
ncbi:hypothetical protein, conserved [Babesia ovata]|uniref:Extracellular matrix-binding ebh n=1 Tax=Babesia ovata TaxID=189622 RepID=A0A2H6KIU3_9APIC|nr:uncharacterized protein BOVATA_044070 [Babesia ovata]GBE62914.1 hypothetical protein, conserved [Babesia ovata]